MSGVGVELAHQSSRRAATAPAADGSEVSKRGELGSRAKTSHAG
jgi:hypothetical protein